MHEHASFAASQEGRLTLLDLPVSIIYIIIDELFHNELYKYYGLTSLDSGYDIKEEIDTPADETYRAFDHWKDLSRMAASCRSFYNIVTPILYRLDVQCNYSSALLLSAKKGNIGGVIKSIGLGRADPNMEDHTDFVEDEYPEARANNCNDFWRHGITSTLTALHLAAFYAHPVVVDFLLDNGADVGKRADMAPEARRGFGMYTHDQIGMFSHTIQEYDIMKREEHALPPMGANALFFALKADRKQFPSHHPDKIGIRLPMAKRLIKAGASLVTRSRGKIHALHQACAYLDLDVAEFLIGELGVDPNVRDSNGNTPLHFMAMNFYESRHRWHGIHRHERNQLSAVFYLLLREGADVDAPNHAGHRPLHLTMGAERESIDLACLLTYEGAEFDARANELWGQLHLEDADEDVARIDRAFSGLDELETWFERDLD